MPIFMTVKNIHYTLMISHNVHNPRAQSSTRAQHEIHRLKARALTICTQKHKTYNPQKMQDYNYVEFSSDWKIQSSKGLLNHGEIVGLKRESESEKRPLITEADA